MEINKINSTKGFVAVQTIIALTLCLAVFILFVSFLSYSVPKITLEKQVQNLAQIAKKQGGLTNDTSQPVNSDISVFKSNLAKMGYNPNDIEITAKSEIGNQDLIGITPLNSKGTNYLKRDSKDLIDITVSVPSKKTAFDIPLKLLGLKNNKISDKYIITEVVGSERW